jgi:hypothetical protein
MEYGILSLIVLALDIWALIQIWSGPASTASKLLWTLLILFLPVLGFILWLIFGPRGSRSAA